MCTQENKKSDLFEKKNSKHDKHSSTVFVSKRCLYLLKVAFTFIFIVTISILPVLINHLLQLSALR